MLNALPKGEEGSRTYHAIIVVSKGGESRTVKLHTSFNHEANYVPVFGKEIGLGFTTREMAYISVLHAVYRQSF